MNLSNHQSISSLQPSPVQNMIKRTLFLTEVWHQILFLHKDKTIIKNPAEPKFCLEEKSNEKC